jgi:signal transduction histidine kinase
VELRFNLSPDELLIKADPSQIEQILMNLVINAGEAIPPQTDGRIDIATSNLRGDAANSQRVRAGIRCCARPVYLPGSHR